MVKGFFVRAIAGRFPHHVRRGFPKEIRIGVIVQLSGKNMNGPDEVLGGFMRGGDKAGIAWKRRSSAGALP